MGALNAYRGVLSNSALVRLLSGEFISGIGDWLYLVALLVVVYQESNDPLLLGIVGAAAIRLGRYEDAEAAARRHLALPPSAFGDPASHAAREQVHLAHALAAQGKDAEAAQVLAPALGDYQDRKQAGATGTSFRLDYAEALYVSTLIQAPDPAGRAARRQALDAAAAELSTASAEVRQLREARELARWIAEARSAPAT